MAEPVAHHLIYGEAVLEQLNPVTGGRLAKLGTRLHSTEPFRANSLVTRPGPGCLLQAKDLGELLQKQGNAVLELWLGRTRRGPLGDLRSAASDQFFTVCGEELVQHDLSLVV